jgi:AmpD protein
MPDAKLLYDPTTGWMQNVVRLPSPHVDDRPVGMKIDTIVIHAISLPPGEFGGEWVEQFFMGQPLGESHPFFKEIAQMRVSSHFYIKREGVIVQFVPVIRRAWHAGESCFEGRRGCNDYSVGIELEGTDTEPFTPVQYEQLSVLCQTLMTCYPNVTPDRIVGHATIAPGRKTDPGPWFEWDRLQNTLKGSEK